MTVRPFLLVYPPAYRPSILRHVRIIPDLMEVVHRVCGGLRGAPESGDRG